VVAKAICDWKSIMTRVWSFGVSSLAPGVALAVMVMVKTPFLGFCESGLAATGEMALQHRKPRPRGIEN
jgi:hypothetical protein